MTSSINPFDIDRLFSHASMSQRFSPQYCTPINTSPPHERMMGSQDDTMASTALTFSPQWALQLSETTLQLSQLIPSHNCSCPKYFCSCPTIRT
jgi:hypothetical protein